MSDNHSQTVPVVRKIMAAYCRRTGVSSAALSTRRYLWTDAFAVCNFLELYRQTGEQNYLDTALRLVEQVHSVLGKYSDTDSRNGWISGLDENAGSLHPTRGGLRIGKNLTERGPDEPLDQRLEWDRDGQYFHYLTKWMHALSQVSRVTGDERYQHWALELAKVSHAGFTYSFDSGERKRMYWKMSVDLSRPLVSSMGHHDSLDALITYTQLSEMGRHNGRSSGDIELKQEIADCQAMCVGKNWATEDPLGTGGLLADAFRLAQLIVDCNVGGPLSVASLLSDCEAGLHAFVRSGSLDQRAEYRLAFRELGLVIGLHALNRLQGLIRRNPDMFAMVEDLSDLLARLNEFGYLCDEVEGFWLQAAHQQNQTWCDHEDINAVMLATSLAPDSFLLVRQASPPTIAG